MKFKIIFIFCLLINLSSFFDFKKVQAEEYKWIVNDDITLLLEISDNFQKRKIGLMNRESLKSNQGMIFIYERLEPINIWMFNTLIPLDIIFLKENKIIKITHNAMPCLDLPCKLYPSLEPVDMIIEINGGQAKILNLKVGDNLNFLKKEKY